MMNLGLLAVFIGLGALLFMAYKIYKFQY